MTAIGEVPTDPDAIDAQWLTWALRSSGMLTSGSVSDVRVEPVSGSGGFAGQLRRLHVSYQGLVDEAPSSIVMKLHSPDESTRALIWRLRAAEREIRFYREFAVDAGVPTALMYFAELHGQRYVMLLEDLAPACAGDLLAEIHPEEIHAAVADVAYYLTSAVPRRVRCQLEVGVLRRYHAALVDEGVSDYSFGCCFEHYRLAIADLLSRVVVLTTRIQPEGPSRSKTFEVLAERVAGAVVDLNCAARLESAP